jgi:hypothetical protein
MSIRLTIEGDEQQVDKYIRCLSEDKRYKYYVPHEFSTSITEKKVEYYVGESPSRMQEMEKKRLYKLTLKTTDGEEIILDLLDLKVCDLLDGKTTLIGTNYDIYADPLHTA